MLMQFTKITTGCTEDGCTVSADDLSLNPQARYHCISCGNPLRLHVTHTAGRYFEHDLEQSATETLETCTFLLSASNPPPVKPLTPFAQALQENIQRGNDTLGLPGLQHYFCAMCERDYHGKKCCLYCDDTHYTTEISNRDAEMVAIGTAPLSLSVAEQNRYFEHLTLSTLIPVAEQGATHPGVTHDLDRLTEPYLLLQNVLSAMAATPLTPTMALSICSRLSRVEEAVDEGRRFHPTLQRCAALIGQYQEDARNNETVCMNLIRSLLGGHKALAHQQVLTHWLREGYQYRSLACQWLAGLSARYPSFVMVGLELAYQQSDTQLARLTQDLSHFLDGLPSQDGLTHSKGVFWHREYGRVKGHFAQVLVFFPADQPDTGPALAKQMGEYWQQTVTQGRGRYVANDVEQKVYRYPGCLSVLPQREDTLDEVKWALTAITEMDFCARLALPEGESVCGVVSFDKTDAPRK
ncbi:conserved hypothetical protein [Enterobacterales bacterium 8AC]|nr:conserved hypothetical protein [Enterobacterales bacterium 8AC]